MREDSSKRQRKDREEREMLGEWERKICERIEGNVDNEGERNRGNGGGGGGEREREQFSN